MLHDVTTRHKEALRYWKTMQAPAMDMPFDERRSELRLLADFCESEVLRTICEKNLNSVGRRPVRQRLSETRA